MDNLLKFLSEFAYEIVMVGLYTLAAAIGAVLGVIVYKKKKSKEVVEENK